MAAPPKAFCGVLSAPAMGRGRPVAVAVLGLRSRVWARPPGLRFRLTRYARQCAPLSRRLPPSAPPSRALASARRRSGLRWALPVGFASVRPAPPVGRAPRPSLGGLAARCPPGLPPRCGAPAAPVPRAVSLARPCPAGCCGLPLVALAPLRARPLRPVGLGRPSRAAPRFGPARCGGPLRRFAPCPRSSRAGAVRACGPPCVAPRPRVSGVGVFRPLRRAASPVPRLYSIQQMGQRPRRLTHRRFNKTAIYFVESSLR